MDAKIIVYGFCLLAIVAGSTFWRYAMEIDDVEKEVVLARQNLNNVEEGLRQAKAWGTARKEAAALLAAASVIKESNDALYEEIQVLQKKRMEVAKSYMSAVERARAETAGMELPEITLATGGSLKNAKIQSIDEELTVIKHSEGVAKIATKLLPAMFKDRLRYGFNPLGLGSLSTSGARSGGTKNSDTSISDQIAKMGANGAAPEAKPTETPPVPDTAGSASVAGQRESLGRIYVPGKGWQRAGAGGFIAPPTVGAPTTPSSTADNPEAVSKVKSRLDTNSSTGTQP